MPRYRDGFKPDKRCKTCKLILAGDEKLFNRIAMSRQFTSDGESLSAIQRDYEGKITYLSIHGHAKKHQAPNSEKLMQRRMSAIQAKRDQLQYREIKKTADVRQSLLEKLAEKMDSGDFDDKMTVRDLIAVLRDADNAEAKKKDQAIDIMKMMMPSRSGEFVEGDVVEEFDPWKQQD